MKRKQFQLIMILFVFHLVSCNGISRPTASKTDAPDLVADSLSIRSTLDGWYQAMYKIDSIGILSPLTAQFLLLEDTIPFTGTELFARLKKGGTETKWTAEFSDFHTRFHGDVAWTTLKNHETTLSKDGKKCQADFLETIVFVRNGQNWLIDRYHAAAVNHWHCED
jgi:ketosteroid isomerase-like protein